MFNAIRKVKKVGCLSLGICTSAFLSYGETNKITQNTKHDLLKESQNFYSSSFDMKSFLEESLAKKLKGVPFLKISCSNINDFCNKGLKIVEKFYPEMSSILSLSLTSFLGGTQCPGEEGTSPIHTLLFFHEGHISGAVFFKASEETPFFKTLSSFKNEKTDLINLSSKEDKKAIWWMFGEPSLLSLLQQKDVNTAFPFLNSQEGIDCLLKAEFDTSIINSFMDGIPFLEKQIWETFVKDEIKRFCLGLDYIDNNIIAKYEVETYPNSSFANLLKGINTKSLQVRYLDLTSQEGVKNFGFQDFEGVLTFLNSVHTRLKTLHETIDKGNKQTKTNDEWVAYTDQVFKWWDILYPLITEVLSFGKDNLTGNFQSYANVKPSQKYFFEAVGFGLFEGKSLTNEKLVTFLKNFITSSLTEHLKNAIKQKLLGSDLLSNLSCVFNKNTLNHREYPIQSIYWQIKGENSNKIFPLYFSVCKNYLLYSDNFEDIKRLIERIDAIKTFTYVSMPECFEKMQIRLTDFIPISAKMPIFMDYTYATNINPERLNITCKVPLWFNLEDLKNFSNTVLPSPQKNEGIKKDNVNVSTKQVTQKS